MDLQARIVMKEKWKMLDNFCTVHCACMVEERCIESLMEEIVEGWHGIENMGKVVVVVVDKRHMWKSWNTKGGGLVMHEVTCLTGFES